MADAQNALSEDQLARQLEQAHQQILDSESDHLNRATTPSNAMKSAQGLLAFIERVKRARIGDDTSVGAMFEPTDNSLLDTGAIDRDSSQRVHSIDSSVSQAESFSVRQSIGRFEIEKQVGRGGFGVVFLARDPHLDRQVALKVPRPEVAFSNEMQSRFIREGQALAALSHPNIVQVFEAGRADVVPYIASQYIDGMTLAHWRKKNPGQLDFRQSTEIVSVLAEAVQHAHARGVLHRDLKPGNVLLELNSDAAIRGDLAGAARISDFGLAKFTYDSSTETRVGDIVGTPAYMSPEQTVGDQDEVGPKTDIYALGSILYELLTGEHVFQGESASQLIKALRNEKTRPLREIDTNIPRDLEAICLKCLEKSPIDRYETAYHLKADLDRFLEGVPVSVRPVSRLDRIKLWAKRNPALAVVGTAAALFFIAALSATSFGLVSTSRALEQARLSSQQARTAEAEVQKQKNVAVAKSNEALTQARHARMAVDELLSAIEAEPTIQSEGLQEFRQKLLSNASSYYRLISTEQPDDLEVLAEYCETVRGLAYLNGLLGDNQRADGLWKAVIEIRETSLPQQIAPLLDCYSGYAENLTRLGRFDELVELADQLMIKIEDLDLDQSSSRENVELMIKVLAYQAHGINNKGQATRADEMVNRAILMTNLVTGELPAQWPAAVNWGRVARAKTEIAARLPDYPAVEKYAPQIIRIFGELKEQHPNLLNMAEDAMASGHRFLGISHGEQGRREQALIEFENERQLIDSLIDRNPQIPMLTYARCMNRYHTASTQNNLNRLEEAKSLIEAQLPVMTEKQNEFPQLNAHWWFAELMLRQLLGKIFVAQNETEMALAALQEAIQVCEKLCALPQTTIENQAWLGSLYNDMGSLFLAEGKSDEAIDLIEKAIEQLEQVVQLESTGMQVQSLEFAYQLHADALFATGQYEAFVLSIDHYRDKYKNSDKLRKADWKRTIALAHLGKFLEAAKLLKLHSDEIKQGDETAGLLRVGAKAFNELVAAGGPNEDQLQIAATCTDLLRRMASEGFLDDESVRSELQNDELFAKLRDTEPFKSVVADAQK